MDKKYSFQDFIDIIATLRSENGCPWDKEQTHQSLRQAMLEEAYEAADAIDKNDSKNLCEELGDVLLQVALHSQIAKEYEEFDIDDVIDGISRKMIFRHPHIFGENNVKSSDEVLQNWDKLKRLEKGFSSQTEVLKAVPKALPATIRASKVQKKAADVNFDFKNIEEVLDKVDEEVLEFKQELAGNMSNIEGEFGDILFSLVNLARKLKINPEKALTKSTEKFINRFEKVEISAISAEKDLTDMNMTELDMLWDEAKKQLDINEN